MLASAYAPQSHWLLKAPFHMLELDTMFAEYGLNLSRCAHDERHLLLPLIYSDRYGSDTKVIFCHRDPIEAISGTLSLWTSVAQAEWSNVDVTAVARRLLSRSVEVRTMRKAMKNHCINADGRHGGMHRCASPRWSGKVERGRFIMFTIVRYSRTPSIR